MEATIAAAVLVVFGTGAGFVAGSLMTAYFVNQSWVEFIKKRNTPQSDPLAVARGVVEMLGPNAHLYKVGEMAIATIARAEGK